MHGNQNVKQFQVALLIDNISEAKEISDSLRELGIYAHFYDDLDEFWVAANTQTPDLTIIDVKKMSSGKILFKNHPKVKSNALCYAFYYSDSSKVLLNSTFNLNHYGYIRREVNIVGQVQAILRKKNQELHLIDENDKLAKRVDRLQKRSQRIIDDAQMSFNFENQFQHMMDLVDRVGEAKTKDEFMKNLINVFGQWQACEKFGMYYLTQNGQKLISPQIIKPKYKHLPPLWLSQACATGMTNYAIEMAEEVAYDSLEKFMRVVKIHGSYDTPDIILVGAFSEHELKDFQWEVMEQRLSNIYRKQQLLETKTKANQEHKISIWESFSYLDDIHFHQAKSKHKLFVIDFSNLLNVIKEKHGNRFYWNSFFADFQEELSSLLSGSYKLSEYGAQNILIFFDKTYLDIDYHKVKAFVNTYEFWRYFEDSSIMMSEDMLPEFKAVAASSVNLIRQVYADIMNSGSQSIRRHKSVWDEKEIRV